MSSHSKPFGHRVTTNTNPVVSFTVGKHHAMCPWASKLSLKLSLSIRELKETGVNAYQSGYR